MNIGISIIVCCYNSEKRIGTTLTFLSQQQNLADIPCEIIIVDNNCNDTTIDVAKSTWLTLNTSIVLKIISESTPGLTNARKAGVRAAKFEYIIFCDDDNWLDPFYAYNAFQKLKSNPGIGAVGGWSEAAFECGNQVPDWFDVFKKDYAVGRQALKSGDVTTERGYLWGAGLAFRRSLFCVISNDVFPMLLNDRRGKELSAGGDSEICLRFILAGYKLYYSEHLFFRHHISPDRLTLEYRTNQERGFQDAKKILSKYYSFIKLYLNSSVKPLDTFIGHTGYLLGKLLNIDIAKNPKLRWRISIFTSYQTKHLDPDLRNIKNMYLHFKKSSNDKDLIIS